jgi:FtsZ-binding cell division protein ZapB
VGQLDTIDRMLNEIESLAEKTDALISVVNQLRQENASLRREVAQIRAAQKNAEERLVTAAQKVESLLEKLP